MSVSLQICRRLYICYRYFSFSVFMTGIVSSEFIHVGKCLRNANDETSSRHLSKSL